MARKTICIEDDTHKELISHLELDNAERKIYKFVEAAIKEKIEREKEIKIKLNESSKV